MKSLLKFITIKFLIVPLVILGLTVDCNKKTNSDKSDMLLIFLDLISQSTGSSTSTGTGTGYLTGTGSGSATGTSTGSGTGSGSATPPEAKIPKAVADTCKYLYSKPIPCSVLDNDDYSTSDTIIIPAKSEKGGILSLNTDNKIQYTPSDPTAREDKFSYYLKNVDGNISNSVEVIITIVDDRAFQIISASPAKNSSTQSLNEPIKIVFSKPVKQSTINDKTFFVKNNISGNKVYDPKEPNTIWFYFTSTTEIGRIYQINVKDIEDIDGNKIEPSSWFFSFKKTYQWVKQYGTSGSESTVGVTKDSDGNLISIVNLDFCPITGCESFEGKPTIGKTDIAIIKTDKTGTTIWSDIIGTSEKENAVGLYIDPATKNIYVIGNTRGNLEDNTNLSPLYQDDVFIKAYTKEGKKLFTNHLTNGLAFRMRSYQGFIYILMYTKILKVDTNGQILQTINYSNCLTDTNFIIDSSGNFLLAGSTINKYNPSGCSWANHMNEPVIIKMNSTGSIMNWKQYSGNSSQSNAFFSDIGIDSSNNVIILGVVTQDGFFNQAYDSGQKEMVLKLDSQLNKVFYLQTSGKYHSVEAKSIYVLPSGEFYIGGSALFDDGFTGNTASFISIYDQYGNEKSSELIGGGVFNEIGDASSGSVLSIFVDNGSVYLTGYQNYAFPGNIVKGQYDAYLMQYR